MIVPQLSCKVFADWPKGRQGPSLVCSSCQMNTLCCLTRSTHDHGKATCFTAKVVNFGKKILNWKAKKLEISSITILPELILLQKMKLLVKKLTTEAMF